MIRYATAADADWIVSLQEANPEIVVSVQRGDALQEQIRARQYIINESDDGAERYSFIRFLEMPDHVRSLLLLTEEEHRQKGYATELYRYILAKYQKPLRYFVEAGSENEQIWTKRSEAVENSTQQVGSTVNSEGTPFNEYEAKVDQR